MEKEKFDSYIILKGTYWDLQMHHSQNLLGRCLLWYKGENKDFLSITKEEQEEFWDIATKTKKALDKLFKPDKYNYTCTGNRTNHLHVHILPRYKEKKEFEGEIFEDKDFGSFPIKETVTTKKLLTKIKEVIQRQLS